MKKIFLLLSALSLFLALVWVWSGHYLWPEALTWLQPVLMKVKLTVFIIIAPLLIAIALHSLKAWQKYRKKWQEDQELQYLRREKKRLDENWKKLLRHLKLRPNGHNIYSLPWLMLLGDNNSGKSSWLQQAGFERIKSVGSGSASDQQKNDDVVFWVGDHGVVLEMADHFLNDDANELDGPVLQHLYSLLRRHRPRQPLTGVMVTQAASQLVMQQPSFLQGRARQLKQRLRELDAITAIRLPVWILVTQCDQLEGFQAFFSQVCSTEHGIPVGVSLPEGYQPEEWLQRFKGFQSSITGDFIDLLHNEKELSVRRSLTRFLLQTELLQDRLKIGLDEIYGHRHQIPDAWIAGVWFSSTTQKGDSYNLLARELGKSWGFKCQYQQPQRRGSSSYFVRNFFPSVAMKNLVRVGESPLAHRLWQVKIFGGFVLGITLLAGSCWVLRENVLHNHKLHMLKQNELSQYQSEINRVRGEPSDLITPLLRLRDLSLTFQKERPAWLSIGLFVQDESEKVNKAYTNQLQQRLFLPLSESVKDTLETYVQQGDHHKTFQHLVQYMMLFDNSIRNKDELNSYIVQLLLHRGELPSESRENLVLLLNDLWALPRHDFEPDHKLVAQARDYLDQKVDNQLVYDFIRSSPEYSRKIDIRKRLGENFSANFSFKAGFEGYYLPVIFTKSGYSQLDLTPESELISQALKNLAKVKGLNRNYTLADKVRIADKVKELYFFEYIRTWKSLVNNIQLQRRSLLTDQLQQLQSLYLGDTPALFDLVTSIAHQTQLQAPDVDSNGGTGQLAARQAERKALNALKLKGAGRAIASRSGRDVLSRLKKQHSAAIVNEAFSDYATFLVDRGTLYTEGFDNLNEELYEILSYSDHQQGCFASVIKLKEGGDSSLQKLKQLALQEKTEVGVWVTQLADELWQSWLSGAGQFVEQRWQSTIYQRWKMQFANRFPFVNGVRQEVRLRDFVEFLRPEGELDQFVSLYLEPFMETGSEYGDPQWSLKQVNGKTLPLSSRLLKQLQRAERVRNVYFSSDGKPSLYFQIRVKRLDQRATRFNLRDSNGNFSYSHGPRLWHEGHWPLASSEGLAFNFANSGLQLARHRYSGPWAWQHFIADSEVREENGLLKLNYSLKSYNVTIDIDTDPNHRDNPFSPALLPGFSLPATILSKG